MFQIGNDAVVGDVMKKDEVINVVSHELLLSHRSSRTVYSLRASDLYKIIRGCLSLQNDVEHDKMQTVSSYRALFNMQNCTKADNIGYLPISRFRLLHSWALIFSQRWAGLDTLIRILFETTEFRLSVYSTSSFLQLYCSKFSNINRTSSVEVW